MRPGVDRSGAPCAVKLKGPRRIHVQATARWVGQGWVGVPTFGPGAGSAVQAVGRQLRIPFSRSLSASVAGRPQEDRSVRCVAGERSCAGTPRRRGAGAGFCIALSAAPGGPARAAGQDGLSGSDALVATEQAIQLDELIKWVRRQAEVDPNRGSTPSRRSGVGSGPCWRAATCARWVSSARRAGRRST